MRIGLVSTPWLPVPPLAYGGLEAVVDRLALGLVAEGHEVLLAAPSNSTCPVPLVNGMAAVNPTDGVAGDTVTEMNHVARAYAAMADVDLVHDHTIGGPLYRHRPPGVPVVTTHHGLFDPPSNYLFQQLCRDTAVVAISRDQADSAQGVPITRVIHHGIDVEQVPAGNGSGGYAVFLGRMCATKGPRRAIEVARRAGMRLLIAAKMREPLEEEYFEAEIRPLLGQGVEYIGEVDEAEKYQLLGDAVALLNPICWREPFGLVMIESMACGTPVVAPPIGSVPEIVDEAKTGFIRESTGELAAALIMAAALERPLVREVAQTRFSTARMVAEHIDLYTELLATR